jgi:hypothetical protein
LVSILQDPAARDALCLIAERMTGIDDGSATAEATSPGLAPGPTDIAAPLM